MAPTRNRRRRPGRPSALGKHYDTQPDGTQRTVADALVEEIRGGEYLETACAIVGINIDTARDALRIAAKLRIANLGHDPTPATEHEAICLAFSVAYKRACAEYERDVLRTVDSIGKGGGTLRTVRQKRRFLPPRPVLDKDGKPTVDKDGNVIVTVDTEGHITERTEEIRDLPPDLNAMIWRLAHRFPKRYSPKLHIIETDPDGELDPADHARELMAGINGYLQGQSDGARST